jgi:hypothetical protein
MTENNALKHVNTVLDIYPDVIKGIFAVKGVGHDKKSVVKKINLETLGELDYADTLRLLFMNVAKSTQQIDKFDLGKIIFELDEYYLILRKKIKNKGSAPLFVAILAFKAKDIHGVDVIFDEFADELFFLLK